MAVDWGLAKPEGGAYDYLQSLQQMGQLAAQKQALSQNQYAFNRQRTADQQRPQIIAQARGGDYNGAQDTAFSNGDMDALKFVGSLQDTQRAQLGQHADAIAAVAANLAKLPADQRRAALAAAAPGLQRFGFTPEEIAAADVSDAGLTGYISAASSTKSALESYYDSQKPLTVADGAQVFGATPMGGGQRPLIAENQKDIVPQKPVWDSERGGWVYPPSAGAPTGSMTPLGGAAPESPAASSVRRKGGWTPKASDGGDNPDGVVDQKIAFLSKALGIDPNARLSPDQVGALAGPLAATEGGPGSLADRNNNPGNIRDGKFARSLPGYIGTGDGGFAKFATKGDGVNATKALLMKKFTGGAASITDIIAGKPVAGQSTSPQAAPSGGSFVPVVAPKNKDYRILTPQEAQQRGLDSQSKWQIGPNNQITALPAKGDKPLTEIQSKATGYLGTMLASSKALAEVRGYNPDEVSIGLSTLGAGNPLKRNISQASRRVLNAQLGFAEAALRLESGAAVTPQEIADKAQVLFPMPGDGPDVQRDKRRQREAAIKGMRVAAGPGSDNFPFLGDTSKTGVNAPRAQPKPGWKITERK